MTLEELKEKSVRIRQMYHELEQQHHGTVWSVEEDALAFLTDAGLVGRLVMDNQKRWPAPGKDNRQQLEHKLGECVWWLSEMADRMDMDIEKCVSEFLTRTEKGLTP